MRALAIIMVVASALLLGAHFLRAGALAFMLLSLAFPFLLLLRKRRSVRALQLVLLLGVVEWILTAVAIVVERQGAGLPWGRSAVIIGAVAVFTALSALGCQSLLPKGPQVFDNTA